jgi:hypothetical protein
VGSIWGVVLGSLRKQLGLVDISGLIEALQQPEGGI